MRHSAERQCAFHPSESSSLFISGPAGVITSSETTSWAKILRCTIVCCAPTPPISGKTLPPNGGGEPTGELAEAINRDFGSFEKFKAHFSAAATSLQGSGWAVLGYDHIADRLIIEQLTDQQGNTSINFTPLLMLDMWEHAFYLQYKNVKADYVKAVWNVFNWDDVAERFAAATK